MLTYYAHYTICLHTYEYPPFLGVVKTLSIPFGQYPPKLGGEGSKRIRGKRGNRVGAGNIRGFFVPKINFFWGGHFLGFFVTVWGKNGQKIKNLWGGRIQRLPPSLSPRSTHVSDTVYEIVDPVVYHMRLRGFFASYTVYNHCGKVVGLTYMT